MAFAEMDNCFVRAIRSIHSASNESQNNIRVLLDEALKSKYGPGKELGPYVNFSTVFQEHPVISTGNTISTIEASSKDEIKAGDSSDRSDNELELDLLKEDLLCVVCKGMGVGARNRLSECSDCHNLYHQECHDPTISDEEIEISGWLCTACKDAQASKAAKKPVQSPVSSVTSSHKNSPSTPIAAPTKSYNDKEFSEVGSSKLLGSKSSSSSSSSTSSKSSSVPNRVMTPNINLVSADKRLQIMKKKAAKLQEKRKLSRN